METLSHIKNRLNQTDFSVSVVPVNKQFTVHCEFNGVPLESIRFQHIRFEAAVWIGKSMPVWKVFTKPYFLVCYDALRDASQRELSDLIEDILTNEDVQIVREENSNEGVFERRGYVSLRRDVFSLFALGKIRVIFIIKGQSPQWLSTFPQ